MNSNKLSILSATFYSVSFSSLFYDSFSVVDHTASNYMMTDEL
jgi:hypothetical protein